MARFIAGFLGLLGLGVIIHGALDRAALGGVRPSLAMVLVPLLALFTMGMGWFRLTERGKLSSKAGRVGDAVLSCLLALLTMGLLAAIPALWWGVIKKLAGAANEGGKFM